MSTYIKYIIMVIVVGYCFPLHADDNERVKQIRSMEVPGYWNFQKGSLGGGNWLTGPIGRFIYNNHLATKALRAILPYTDIDFYENKFKEYSGYNNGGFRESRSKSAINISMLRTSLALMQQQRIEDAIVLKDTISPVFNEHILLAADRNVDSYYETIYRQEFEELGNYISLCLSDVMRTSKGRFKDEVYIIQEQFDVVCSEVEYLHRIGSPANEMPSSQRQEGYETCKKRLRYLALRAEYLSDITVKLFKLNPGL